MPFLSYGGSSLIMVMAAVGVLLSVSRYSSSERVHASGPSGRRAAPPKPRRRKPSARRPAYGRGAV